jgi:hypothetical protein
MGVDVLVGEAVGGGEGGHAVEVVLGEFFLAELSAD